PLLLPACSAGTDANPAAVVTEIATEVVEPEPEVETVDAFHFESGTLELGPFDPFEVYPDVFDPCQEISDEEFAKVGFKTDGVTYPQHEGTNLGCHLHPIEGTSQFATFVTGNIVPGERIFEQAEVLTDQQSDYYPDMLFFKVDSSLGNNCSAAVSTVRGHFIAGSADSVKSRETQAHCQTAKEIIEKLLRS
uniref:DUF3558 family protein n=1 Tax=Corynebacterium sp. TaxID=1720 RepID=UPI003736195D